MGGWVGWEELGGNGRTSDAPAATTFNVEPHVIVRGVEDRIFFNSSSIQVVRRSLRKHGDALAVPASPGGHRST